MSEKPPQPPEGKLIGDAMKRRGMSARSAATASGISDTRWRHIVAGYQPVGDLYVPVSGPPETVARMAHAVGVKPEQLSEVGREDAAAELAKLEEALASTELPVGSGTEPLDLAGLSAVQIEAVKAVIRAMRADRGEH
ncbi:helix-turn-helix domain-containing protein [Modestobacter sp. VKM Ac-2985]|uniref:helix-turn-helix domain-containing protein n=1 Tax=Modestobacter sp. VKM Ac-2985 TaxID=3004139 RepID=UPI0022AB722E|nr:helix-turn-helix domain-containing protein [Modestobacter sp. VKM Ac-2985]MCZ2837181.1 helix-turn-helix domain-containing protein [Modestobacter sp. VKM Ac-2985]